MACHRSWEKEVRNGVKIAAQHDGLTGLRYCQGRKDGRIRGESICKRRPLVQLCG